MEDIKVIRVTEVKKTRKEHKCYDCGETKPTGSNMTKHTFTYEYGEGIHTVYSCKYPCCEQPRPAQRANN